MNHENKISINIGYFKDPFCLQSISQNRYNFFNYNEDMFILLLVNNQNYFMVLRIIEENKYFIGF